MRQIRTLRAMRRELETEPRSVLYGHEGGNPGYSQGGTYGPPRQFSTLPTDESRYEDGALHDQPRSARDRGETQGGVPESPVAEGRECPKKIPS